MPRKSAFELSVVPLEIRPSETRLRPPDGLTPPQVAAWLGAVNSVAADWFRGEHVPMLTAYVHHVVRAAELEALLARLDPIADLQVFERLAKMAGAETAKITMLARAMRFTQQSRVHPSTAATKARNGAVPRGIESLTLPGARRG